MIEAKIDNAKVELKLRGDVTELMAECTMFIESVSRSIADESENPAELIKLGIITSALSHDPAPSVAIDKEAFLKALEKMRGEEYNGIFN